MASWLFACLTVASRVASALYSPIADCDEVFNYWEPAHYLVHGSGMQPWEYSPEYALRSYAYVEVHSIVLRAAAYLGFDKVQAFYALRIALALLCAYCEIAFVKAISRGVNEKVAAVTSVALALSAGMFHAAPAFLPTSFCMYFSMLSFSYWMHDGRTFGAMFCGAAAVLFGWPFVALVFVPVGIDAALRGRFAQIAWCVILGIVAFVAVPAIIDSAYYGTPVSAVWNIVKYNALGMGGNGDGANLYGTEPASFYLKNLALNFNIHAAFGLAALPAVLLLNSTSKRAARIWKCPMRSLVLYMLPLYLAFGMFTAMAHKEERFLFAVYPLLCFCSAVALTSGVAWAESVIMKTKFWSLLLALLIAVSAAVSVSRSLALATYFGAPLVVYEHLSGLNLDSNNATVCVGKEWYRFPSSFFLPQGARLGFVKSSFDGQLPAEYAKGSQGTSIVHDHFNDANKEVASRFTDIASCDFMVDFAVGEAEYRYDSDASWKSISCAPFVDASASTFPRRSFYIPEAFPHGGAAAFSEYCLYERDKQQRASF